MERYPINKSLFSGIQYLMQCFGLSDYSGCPFPRRNSFSHEFALLWVLRVLQIHPTDGKEQMQREQWLLCQIQFSSVAQSCLTLWTPLTGVCQASLSITDFLNLFKLMSIRVDDAIQLSHPLLSPSPAFSLSQHQGFFQWVSSSHQVAKVLDLQLQHQSF